MIRLSDIDAMLERFQYKPGWSFKVFDASEVSQAGRVVHLQVSYRAPNADKPGDDCLFSRSTAVSLWAFESGPQPLERLKHIVKQLVKDTELHEVDEWLKFDGKCVTNPHPENP